MYKGKSGAGGFHMRRRENRKMYSIRGRMIGIVLMCWLLPFVLVIGGMGYYILSNRSDNKAQSLEAQLAFNDQICVERLNNAVKDSKKASYDKEIENAFKYRDTVYKGEGDWESSRWTGIMQVTREYISAQYQSNICFMDTVFWYYDNPEKHNTSIFNLRAGGGYSQIDSYWKNDHEEIYETARELDTAVAFKYVNGRLYLVRNLIDSRFEPIGALVMRINMSYCFSTLTSFPLGSALTIMLQDEMITLQGRELDEEEQGYLSDKKSGYEWSGEGLYVYHSMRGSDYRLSTVMLADKSTALSSFFGYQYVLLGMLLFLIPLMLLLMRLLNTQIAVPIQGLVRAGDQIKAGNLGYQLEDEPGSTEFISLTESFNQMSSTLKYQFDHIYEEELALRDAKIMALQSHINPHFMNNTLEIINWEARLEGNIKVSKMIESLSTLMDAAMDRHKRPEVLLSEEMIYVDAYLYITKERLGKRLTIEKELDEDMMECYVPRLILQPVIENAIEHGIVPNGSGIVRITGEMEEDYLYLYIENSGTLTKENEEKIERLLDPDYDTSKESSGNLGIANVNQRLRILYGPDCGLTIRSAGENRIRARLVIKRGQKEQ